jgi:hypothetical protein
MVSLWDYSGVPPKVSHIVGSEPTTISKCPRSQGELSHFAHVPGMPDKPVRRSLASQPLRGTRQSYW